MLDKMLSDLDYWLIKNNKRIVIHVIGGYALELMNVRSSDSTLDVDSLLEITDEDVINQIGKIGEKYFNDYWFDLGAPSLTSPRGYETRMKKIEKYSNIEMFIVDREDIIKMKVAAYHSRSSRGIYRDLDDLSLLKPTELEISEGVDFYFKEYSKDLSGKFLKAFKDETEELRKELILRLVR